MKLYGLVDCNNFYASCERVFKPSIRNKPVIVLSNNDGAVIARSNESKVLGVKMGTPAFELESLIKKHDIQVFSSNYTLYADLSSRVMNSLSEMCPKVEVYSIDEAFLDLSGLELFDLNVFAHDIRKNVLKWTKIPVSVGIAPTKTLAKVANKTAKKNAMHKGVCIIDTDEKRIEILKDFHIEDVWGIGRKHAERLMNVGVNTALDFTLLPDEWVKKEMSIVGLRMLKELRGISCLEMMEQRENKQGICTSRSFGKMISDFETLSEAVASHALRCAEKLRLQNSAAGILTVFIHTNSFRPDLPQYAKSYVCKLPVASNNNQEIVSLAIKGLQAIYKFGFQYKKAGIIVTGIIPDDQIQIGIFDELDRGKNIAASKVMDKLNSVYGRDIVRLAAQGFNKRWKLKQEKLSPCYTTRFEDLLKIKV